MKMSKFWTPLFVAALALASTGEALAKVSAEEANQLGTTLTCMGAEKAASKDGAIPAFSGKWLGLPPGENYKLHTGVHPVDPYPNDKPLFVITAQNMAQYADHLTAGQKAMFAKHPKTFNMPVYQTRRDFRYTDAVCAATKQNALHAELIDNGMGIKNMIYGGVPFPIPKNGYEVLKNQTLAIGPFTEKLVHDIGVVDPSGHINWGRADNRNLSIINDPNRSGKPVHGNVQAYSFDETMLPLREQGGISVSQEPLNFATGKRLAWNYDPGTRRVRQLPEFGFDQPLGGSSGLMTIDEDRLFNGSPERYNFKLLGKQEIYVPADAFRLNAGSVKYADLLKPGNANPAYMRYELRRVWVLEADLKPGYRHIYKKRMLYIDEDSWHAVMADDYDDRGQLWKHAEQGYYYSPDSDTEEEGAAFYYDLNSGGYVAYNLTQERNPGPVLNAGGMSPADFTPEAARMAGN